MAPRTKTKLLFAIVGILVSLVLAAGMALSLELPGASDPFPSPGIGKYTMLFFIPFVALNPVYLLIVPLGLSGSVPDWFRFLLGVLGLLLGLCWWWFIGGVAATIIPRRRHR